MNNGAQRRLRRVLGLSLYAIMAASGLLGVLLPNSGDWLSLFFAVAFAFTVTYWCIVDGRVVGHPILTSFYWLMFFLWPVAVPIYLIWTRGLRGLGFALLHAIGLWGISLVVFHAVGYLTYGRLWFNFPH
jgi:hypothetical protein